VLAKIGHAQRWNAADKKEEVIMIIFSETLSRQQTHTCCITVKSLPTLLNFLANKPGRCDVSFTHNTVTSKAELRTVSEVKTYLVTTNVTPMPSDKRKFYSTTVHSEPLFKINSFLFNVSSMLCIFSKLFSYQLCKIRQIHI